MIMMMIIIVMIVMLMKMIMIIIIMIVMIVMINMNNLPPVGAEKTGWRGKNRSGCNAAHHCSFIYLDYCKGGIKNGWKS